MWEARFGGGGGFVERRPKISQAKKLRHKGGRQGSFLFFSCLEKGLKGLIYSRPKLSTPQKAQSCFLGVNPIEPSQQQQKYASGLKIVYSPSLSLSSFSGGFEKPEVNFPRPLPGSKVFAASLFFFTRR